MSARQRERRLAWLCLALLGLNLGGGAGLLGLGWAGGAACASLGLMAWLLGLRHAFDADHIAAIDNVTRQLRARGERPVAVGFFFSLGHSSVVLLVSLLLAVGLQRVAGLSAWIGTWGVPASLLASAVFLTAIGMLNLHTLRSLGSHHAPRRFASIAHSRAMFPVGLLFGLNLDTAGEIVLLTASAAAMKGSALPLWATLLFPLLFTAGMAAADSAQGLMMMRLYDWAIADRARTLALNTATTGLSVVLALTIAGVQWLALARWAGLDGAALLGDDALDGAAVGLGATLVMAALWLAAWRRRAHATVASGREPL